MKRDWDVIREILLTVEKLEPNALLTLDSVPVEEFSIVSHHLELLQEAGLLQGKIHKTPGGSPHDFHLVRLTWLGYDFLECIRAESKWFEIKSFLNSRDVGITIDYIMIVAKALSDKLLSSSNNPPGPTHEHQI